ncbi:MAG: hypothetical protein ACP5IM_05890 [Candidatus Bathyarchaeia archaeon]
MHDLTVFWKTTIPWKTPPEKSQANFKLFGLNIVGNLDAATLQSKYLRAL